MILTIGIKALNEEKYIAASVASALEAVRPFSGEVILADSGSTDRTVEIARSFPVRIFQLTNADDRSCGAGAQLAFQQARGKYFYILDGDMVLDPGFLAAGISFLESHADVAAVGGRVEDRNTGGEELLVRAQTLPKSRLGAVDRLDGGGLYRTAAVHAIGYFADRNLHAFEEFDLAARLQSQGWKIVRVDHAAIGHYGHTMSGYRLLRRRIRSGYSRGGGEVLRAAMGKPHLPIVLRRLGHVRNCSAVILWWALLVITLLGSPWLSLALLLVPLVYLSVRRRSLKLGLYSLVSWNVLAWGLIRGFMHHRVSPTQPLAYLELSAKEESAAAVG